DTSIDTFIYTLGEGWLNQHIFKVLPKELGQKVYVYYMLRFLKPIFIEIARDKQTTGLGHITGQDLRRLQFVLPDLAILNAFNHFSQPLFEKTLLAILESTTLIKLRDTLLPKLMSGEIPVRDAEALVEAAV